MMSPIDNSRQSDASLMAGAEAVEGTIHDFVRGIRDLDAGIIGRVFHPHANSFSLTPRGVCIEPADRWPEIIRQAKADEGHLFQEKFSAEILAVDVDSTAACAKVEWTFSSARIVDFYNLLKVDGRWLIVNQVYCTHSGRSADTG
jgi:hypothetical protein